MAITVPAPHALRSLLEDERLTIVGLLLEAQRGLHQRLHAVHTRHGLQGSEFSALLRLARSPGQQLRMADIAAQTGTSTSGTTSMVDRLEGAGLVERMPSTQDRRSLLVRLTDAGAQALALDVRELLPVIDEGFIQPVGDDLGVVRAALERARDRLAPEAKGDVTSD